MHRLLFYILISLSLFWSFPSVGQIDSTWHSSIYLEAGGPGSIASVNLEHYSFERENFNIGARFGLGTSRFRNFKNDFQPDYFIPFGGFTNFRVIKNRKSPLYIYLGVGLIYASTVQVNAEFEPERVIKLNGYFQVGVSYYISNKYLLRLSYSPVVSNGYGLKQWGAFSIGHTF